MVFALIFVSLFFSDFSEIVAVLIAVVISGFVGRYYAKYKESVAPGFLYHTMFVRGFIPHPFDKRVLSDELKRLDSKGVLPYGFEREFRD